MEPSPSHRAPLALAEAPARSTNDWTSVCAIAELNGEEWPVPTPLQASVLRCRSILADRSPLRLPLRPSPPADVLEEWSLERERLLHAYHQGDEAGVHRLLSKSRLRSWHLPYPDWVKSLGHLSLPRFR